MSFEIDEKVLDFLIEKNNIPYEDKKNIRLKIELNHGEKNSPRPYEMIFSSIEMHDQKIRWINFTDPNDNYSKKRYNHTINSNNGCIFIVSSDNNKIYKSYISNTTYSKCKISLVK